MKRGIVAVVAVVLLVAGVAVGVQFASGEDDDVSTSDGGSDPSDEREVQEDRFVPKQAYLRDACELPPEWVKYIRRGWDPSSVRNRDLILVPFADNYVGSPDYTPHSGPYAYLQRVPMIWHGPAFIQSKGRIDPGREITVADIAPTQAELLGFDWPSNRSQPPMTEALVETEETPKLLVTISIDGGGWNVLEEWPDRWPILKRLMDEGINFDNAVVGSSPSITPAAHTSMSTGVFPRYHGVTAIGVRADDGEIVGGFAANPDTGGAYVSDPRINLNLPTLPDLYDQAHDNEPIVAGVLSGNYALGMIGFGAATEGGDNDIVAMLAKDGWGTNEEFYSVPEYLNTGEIDGPEDLIDEVDRADGKADDEWQGHEIGLDSSPALAPYQNRITLELLEREGMGQDELADLLYIQYKAPDSAGHKYNMINPEQGDVIESVDTAVGELIGWLDDNVGEDEYAMVITADHGQTPLEQGGWPITRNEVYKDVEERFAKEGVDAKIIQRTSSTSFFMDRQGMKAHGVSPEEISSFLSRYTIGENVPDDAEVLEGFEDRLDERIFAAVFPGRELPDVVSCTGALEEVE